MVCPFPAALVTAAGGGDVLKAVREVDVVVERPSRQSWVLSTTDPSTQMTDAMSEATEETGATVEERLGRLTVKLATGDGVDDLVKC